MIREILGSFSVGVYFFMKVRNKIINVIFKDVFGKWFGKKMRILFVGICFF